MSHDCLSYDTNIPMAMWFDEKIDPVCIKLYAIVRSLANKFGYCFATNEYLADTMKASSRSVQGWMAQLKKEGYLEIETEKNGIQWQRRIYISDKFKKTLRRENPFTPPRKILHPPTQNPAPITKEYSKEEYSKEETPPTPSEGEGEVYGNFVRLKEGELPALVELFGKEQVMQIIDEINDYLSSTGKKPYKDYAATIRNWMRRRKQNTFRNQSMADINKEWAIKTVKPLNHREIEFYPEALAFVNPSGLSLIIPFKEFGFKDQVKSRLRKMNVPLTEV